jgi:excinuclease ABC subunit B
VADAKASSKRFYIEPEEIRIAADPVVQYMAKPEIEKLIAETQRKMEAAAKELDFLQAARYRDELMQLREKLKS